MSSTPWWVPAYSIRVPPLYTQYTRPISTSCESILNIIKITHSKSAQLPQVGFVGQAQLCCGVSGHRNLKALGGDINPTRQDKRLRKTVVQLRKLLGADSVAD